MFKYVNSRFCVVVIIFLTYRFLIEHTLIIESFGPNVQNMANRKIRLHSNNYVAIFGRSSNDTRSDIANNAKPEVPDIKDSHEKHQDRDRREDDLNTANEIEPEVYKPNLKDNNDMTRRIDRKKKTADVHDKNAQAMHLHRNIHKEKQPEKKAIKSDTSHVGKTVVKSDQRNHVMHKINIIKPNRDGKINVNEYFKEYKRKKNNKRVHFPTVHYLPSNFSVKDTGVPDKSLLVMCEPQIVKIPSNNTSTTKIPLNTIKKKQIVWYDIGNHGHGLRNSIENIDFEGCPISARNCEIMDHNIVNTKHKFHTPIKGDAVIMQGSHLLSLAKLPRKDPNQIFVLAECNSWWGSKTFDNFQGSRFQNAHYFVNKFNWTMTYRRDSDIYLPNGRVNFREHVRDSKNYSTIFSWKKFDVACIVNHCTTQSRRELYVAELRKHVDVHTYGTCGDNECVKGDETCLHRIVNIYKFILSFENAYHTNYVTEELFYWFQNNIVPVVRGGETQYSNYGIPTGTIINAEEFESPKKLGMFLQKVGSNEKLYTDFLRRKAGYSVTPLSNIQSDAYCKLCERLNNLDTYRQYYSNIGAWFGSNLNNHGFCMQQPESN